MAFTIRQLSSKATAQLEELKKKDFINTNTKAVEYALEHISKLERDLNFLNQDLRKYRKMENDYNELKYALKVIKNVK